MTTTTYNVTGLTCEHCARAVTGELAAIAGVSAVTVELAPGGTSLVSVTSDQPLSADAVASALGEAGGYLLLGQGGGLAGKPARASGLPRERPLATGT
jgi:copper chaperone